MNIFNKRNLINFIVLTIISTNVLGQGIDSAWMEKYISKFSSGIGEELSDIPLIDIKGKTISLKEFRGKTLYINIWSTTCAPCLAIYPKEQELIQKIAKMDLSDSVLFINICTELTSDIDDWKKIVMSRQDNSINLYSSDSAIFDKWRMKIIWPTYVLMDKDGKCLGKKVPRPDESGIPFMLLAATKGISAKDSKWTAFINDNLLRKGYKNIDPLYLNYLEKYNNHYLPYTVWKTKQDTAPVSSN